MEGYGWNLGVSQLPFLSLLVGSFIGYAGFCAWNKMYFVPRYEKSGGKLAPEHRLVSCFGSDKSSELMCLSHSLPPSSVLSATRSVFSGSAGARTGLPGSRRRLQLRSSECEL